MAHVRTGDIVGLTRRAAPMRVLTGALAALVLALTALTVAQRVADRNTEFVEPISADAFYALDGPLTCDRGVKEVPTLPLEAEPRALLICADPEGSMPWTAPADLVEGDLTSLVEAMSDLERAPERPYDCTFQGGPAYDLLLRFSRDRFARIHGSTGGCGVVTTASGEWFGAQEVLDEAITAVEEQRASSDPPAEVRAQDLSCSRVLTRTGPALSFTGEPADFVRMVSCWQPNGREPGAWSETIVAPDDVRTLALDITRLTTRTGDSADLGCRGGRRTHYFQQLIGQTAWGDILVIPGECRRFYTSMSGDEPSPVWHPSPPAQRILDRLRR